MNNKEEYKKLCEKEDTIPIFSQYWWMDAVCGEENWDVILIKKGDQIVATLPYYIKRKWGMRLVVQPTLTQTNGLWIKYIKEMKSSKRISYEREIIYQVDRQLAKEGIDFFSQNFHYSFVNWSPFYWRGYKQTTRYTYVLEDLSDLDKIWDGINKSTKKGISKVKGYNISETEDIDSFYRLNKMVFEEQGLKIPYTFTFLKSLDKKCKLHNARKIWKISNKQEKTVNMLYLIFDKQSSYLLMSGKDPNTKALNLNTILVWNSIKFSSKNNLRYDFEGSMLEGVASFNNHFGASPIPYHRIEKAFTPKGKFYFFINRLLEVF